MDSIVGAVEELLSMSLSAREAPQCRCKDCERGAGRHEHLSEKVKEELSDVGAAGNNLEGKTNVSSGGVGNGNAEHLVVVVVVVSDLADQCNSRW